MSSERRGSLEKFVRAGAAGALGALTLIWLGSLEPVLFQVGTVLLTVSLVPLAAGFSTRGGAILGLLFGILWIAGKLGLADFVSRENVLSQANVVSVLAMVAIGVLSGSLFGGMMGPSSAGFSTPASEPGGGGMGGVPTPFRNGLAIREDIHIVLRKHREWMNNWDRSKEPWGSFDVHLRELLRQLTGAMQIRCYRNDGSGGLVPLTGPNSLDLIPVDFSKGLLNHVLSGGQSFVSFSATNGQRIQELAEADETDYAWIQPIRYQKQTIGLITVGEFASALIPEGHLEFVADLVEEFWQHMYEADALRSALLTDRASGVLGRTEFLSIVDEKVAVSYANHEPVVILTLVVEGIRRLDDQGQWQIRNEVIEAIGHVMRTLLRHDDMVGRFSDERFVAVLRRMDIPLAELIARKLLDGVEAQVRAHVPEHSLILRVGIAGSGLEQVPAAQLLVRAFDMLSEARSEDVSLVSDSSRIAAEVNVT